MEVSDEMLPLNTLQSVLLVPSIKSVFLVPSLQSVFLVQNLQIVFLALSLLVPSLPGICLVRTLQDPSLLSLQGQSLPSDFLVVSLSVFLVVPPSVFLVVSPSFHLVVALSVLLVVLSVFVGFSAVGLQMCSASVVFVSPTAAHLNSLPGPTAGPLSFSHVFFFAT